MSLFNYSSIQVLYENARRYDEFSTKKFWEHLLNKAVFTGFEWIVAIKQPPHTLESLRHIDIEVDHVQGGHITILMFAELQRIRATPKNVPEAQTQVMIGCQSYCRQFLKQRVWAMTCYGPYFRLWAYDVGDNTLFPVCPATKEQRDNMESMYLDFKENENELMRWFEVMKNHHVPDEKTLKKYLDIYATELP